MKTRITELFGIKYPVILPGMSWISVPSMVAAVSNAGGLGILATGPLNAEQTREAIREIRSLTNKPFGAGATLLFPGAKENAKVLLEEKVPVINFSLGKGDWIVKEAHAYGGKVYATVTTERHALAAESYGADAVQVTGHEAAAHGSFVTSLVLVPRIAELLKIPIIATGGFGDGRGLAAALSLGAEGIAMGSRFSITKESPLHEVYKKLTIEKGIEDTIYSNRFDGMYCRFMKTKASEKIVKRGFGIVSFYKSFFNSKVIAKQLNLPFVKLFIGVLLSGWKSAKQLANMANGFASIKVATENGDLKNGVHIIGQVQGLIHDMPTVKEVMERTVADAKAMHKKMDKMF